MKKSAFFVFAMLLLLPMPGQAQFKLGVRAGLSTTNLDRETINQNGLSLAIKDAKYGYHLGLFARVGLGKALYLQPEALFNSNTVDFEIDEMGSAIPAILQEKYQNLDLPLMLGLKLGPIRLEGGPVGHVFIQSKSELEGQVVGYAQRFKDFNLGYQAGLGLDIGQRLLLDVRYEGNFNNFGDHIVLFDQPVAFSQNPTRIVATIGI
ncbi:MAG TPA: PorT family protein, partial [Bacteroidetes bacterium]|nr:PorT family protein [Bacteroidota bacterium]